MNDIYDYSYAEYLSSMMTDEPDLSTLDNAFILTLKMLKIRNNFILKQIDTDKIVSEIVDC